MTKKTPEIPNELTVQQVAEQLKVSQDTVTRMLHAGDLKGRRRNPFAQRSAFLIPASELERVKNLMQGDLPKSA